MLVYLDGEVLEEHEARISIFDHGLVTGDGAFETLAIYKGQVFAVTRHLERLARTCKGMRLEPPDLDEVEKAIRRVVEDNGIVDGKVRITYTAGDSGLGSARSNSKRRLIVACEVGDRTTFPTMVAISPWPRSEIGVLAGLKTTSYAENVICLDWALERGASEVIFKNLKGQLCEGSGSNIFFVMEGQLYTPAVSTGCLAGVTRDLIVERLGAKEIEIEAEVLFEENVDEAFLSSTLREVQPIAKVDSREFSNVPGPVTIQTARGFQEIIAEGMNP